MSERIFTCPIGVFSENRFGDYDTLVLHLTRKPADPPYLVDDEEWRLQSSKGASPLVLSEDGVKSALHWIFMHHANLVLDK